MAKRNQVRRPNYRIRALRKGEGLSAEIGVAYNKDNDRIELWFNPFVTVPVGPDYVLSLFPEGKFPDRPAPSTGPLPEGVGSPAGAGSRFDGLDFPEEA